jgi:integrase
VIRTVVGALGEWLALHSHGRKPRSIQFNREIFNIILREWPGYLNASASSISTADVLTFAERVSRYCPSRWNALVGALRFVSPAARVLELRPLHAKERPLISPEDFERLLQELRQRPRSHGALVIEFLARTGLRINAARQLRWCDVKEDCLCVPGVITKNGKPQAIPFINGLRELLEKLRAVAKGARADFVLPQVECKRALNTACEKLGLPHLAHHDFRHLFATRCIQSGVDLPTVARWLGHRDGGALLAKTYFHLVDEHSRRMAAKVVL